MSRVECLEVCALIFMLAAVLLDGLVGRDWTSWVSGGAVLVTAAVCARSLKGAARYFCAALGAGSILLVARFPVTGPQVMRAATSGGLVLSFLLLMEVLGAAVNAGRYDLALTAVVARYARSSAGLRRAAVSGGFVLSLAGMFMGAVPASFFALGGRPGKHSLPLALAASRGFAAAVLINPISPLVVLALDASHATLGGFLLCATPMCCLMLLLEWFPLVRRGADRRTTDPGKPTEGAVSAWTRGHGCALAVAALTFWGVFRFLGAFGVNALIRIGMSVAATGLALGFLRPGDFLQALRTLPAERFSKHVGAVPLFAVGGLFGNLVFETGLIQPLVGFVQRTQLPWMEFPLIALVIVGLRWMGLAPVLSLMILGPVFAPVVSMKPTLYALTLAFGGVAGFLGSPLSGTNLFIASVTGLTSFEICVRRQTPYSLFCLAVACIYVWVLNLVPG